jgi:hypothetical protein
VGRGIGGVIPIVFSLDSFRFKSSCKYFSDVFFDFYDRQEQGNKHIYTIKPEQFLPYYQAFLIEFYDMIGEDLEDSTGLSGDSPLLGISSLDEFKNAFEHYERNGRVPLFENSRGMVSVLAIETEESWLFYSGSYKAYLEEFSTFTHFERTLQKAMSSPLKGIVKFCEYG